jgi:hypothetical protein
MHAMVPCPAAIATCAFWGVSGALIQIVRAISWLRVLISDAGFHHLSDEVVLLSLRHVWIAESWASEVARSIICSDWPIALVLTTCYFRAIVPWPNFIVVGLAFLAGAWANVVKRRSSTIAIVSTWSTIAAAIVKLVAGSTIEKVCTFVVLVLGLGSVEHISCTSAGKGLQVRTHGITVKHDVPVV